RCSSRPRNRRVPIRRPRSPPGSDRAAGGAPTGGSDGTGAAGDAGGGMGAFGVRGDSCYALELLPHVQVPELEDSDLLLKPLDRLEAAAYRVAVLVEIDQAAQGVGAAGEDDKIFDAVPVDRVEQPAIILPVEIGPDYQRPLIDRQVEDRGPDRIV